MPSAEIDTLAETRELQAAGIEADHAEAIVSTLRRTTDGLLTESRFEAAMAAQAARFEKHLGEQRVHLEKHLGEQRAYLEKRLGEQTVAIAELKSEIYRYLWLHGSMIVLVLTSLYAMVESWSRGQL